MCLSQWIGVAIALVLFLTGTVWSIVDWWREERLRLPITLLWLIAVPLLATMWIEKVLGRCKDPSMFMVINTVAIGLVLWIVAGILIFSPMLLS